MKIKNFATVILLLLLLAAESNATYPVWGLRRQIAEQLNDIPPLPSPVSTVKEPKANSNNGDKSTNDNPVSINNEPIASPSDGDKSTNDKPVPNSKEPKVSSNNGDKSTNDKPVPNNNEPKASPSDGDKSTNDKPVSNGKEAKASPPDGKSKEIHEPNDPGKSNPKSSNENDKKPSVAGPPPDLSAGGEKNDGKKEKISGNADSKSGSNGSCEGSTEPCRLLNNLTACLQSLDSGSKGLMLIVLNEGESTLKVNITMPTSRASVVNEHVIPGKQTDKISIPPSVERGSKILLHARDEECSFSVGPVTIQQNFLQQLPFNYKQITPIYIAYFVFLLALIFGGVCACCQLRKAKRQDGGVAYQELEMGVPEASSATNVESTDGWDDGWDDDWDDDKAVKSPGHRAVGISANGLTARTSKQDGWGKEWDD